MPNSKKINGSSPLNTNQNISQISPVSSKRMLIVNSEGYQPYTAQRKFQR